MIRSPAVRVADQKLVRQGRKGAWELYDLKSDRTEMHNLADNQLERVQELAARWEAWAKRTQVIPYGDTAAPPASRHGRIARRRRKSKACDLFRLGHSH